MERTYVRHFFGIMPEESQDELEVMGRAAGRRGEGGDQHSWLSFPTKVAGAGAEVMASKADKLRQKALSVVDTVQTLSSTNSSNSCTITVKSSPPRTAAEMTKLSVRRGWMLKKNEQGAWQRRYCCLVPHTFLYYFESKDSEVPRGVIDLDPYTDIEVDPHTGAIVLAPGTEASAFASATGQGTLRKFYFQPEDRWLKAPIATAAAATTTTTATHAPSGGLSGSDEAADGQEGEAAQQEEHPRSTAAGGDRGGGGGGGDEWWSAKQEGERGEALREWLSGLHRERFKVVRDERDAYMNLQEEYMAQMHDRSSATREAETERGRVLQGLRAEHEAARVAARDGLEQARALFRDEDLPPEDAESLSLPALLARVRAVASERRFRQTRLEAELAKALGALEGVRGVEGRSRREEERLRAEAAEATARATNIQARLERAEEEAARERGLRAAAEASLEACASQLEAVRVDAEQSQMNLGIMAGERRAALAKAAELADQKRLLVREVKASRRSLAEASSVNRRLARAYESLETSLRTSSSAQPAPSATATKPSTTTASLVLPPTPSEIDEVDTMPSGGTAGTTAAAGTAAAAAAIAEATAEDVPVAGEGGAGGRRNSSSSSSGSSTRRASTAAADEGGIAPTTAAAATAAPLVESLLARDEWREARLDGVGASAAVAAAAAGRIQVRNLSTGDVGVHVPVVEPPAPAPAPSRSRASTESGGAGGGLVGNDNRATTAKWEPHSSNIGLKITQTFATASWPWAQKNKTSAATSGGIGKGTRAGDGIGTGSRHSPLIPASDVVDSSSSSSEGAPENAEAGEAASGAVPPGYREGDGSDVTGTNNGADVVRDGEDKIAAATDAVNAAAAAAAAAAEAGRKSGSRGGSSGSYSAFLGGVFSSMGSGHGSGSGSSMKGGAGTGTVVPSLHLDEDDDHDVDAGVVVGAADGSGSVDAPEPEPSSESGVDVSRDGASAASAVVGAGGGGEVVAPATSRTSTSDLRCPDKGGSEVHGGDDDGGAENGGGGGGGGGKEGEAAADTAAEARGPESTGVLVCGRCGGTAEGPHNSTCTCAVPQLGSASAEEEEDCQAAVPLSRLKGVFKSFNGGVKVAAQMLDTAVRQNVANNVAPPRRLPPPLPAGEGRQPTSSLPSTSSHGGKDDAADATAGAASAVNTDCLDDGSADSVAAAAAASDAVGDGGAAGAATATDGGVTVVGVTAGDQGETGVKKEGVAGDEAEKEAGVPEVGGVEGEEEERKEEAEAERETGVHEEVRIEGEGEGEEGEEEEREGGKGAQEVDGEKRQRDAEKVEGRRGDDGGSRNVGDVARSPAVDESSGGDADFLPGEGTTEKAPGKSAVVIMAVPRGGDIGVAAARATSSLATTGAGKMAGVGKDRSTVRSGKPASAVLEYSMSAARKKSKK